MAKLSLQTQSAGSWGTKQCLPFQTPVHSSGLCPLKGLREAQTQALNYAAPSIPDRYKETGREGRDCGSRYSAKAGAQTNKCKWAARLGHCGVLNQACCVLILQERIWPSISRSQSGGPRYPTICAVRSNRPDLWRWAQAFPLYFISLLFQEKRKGRFILPLQRSFLKIACSKLMVSSGWGGSVFNKNKNSVGASSFFCLCPQNKNTFSLDSNPTPRTMAK